ncbi:MAG TPA: type IV pili methyl-accepting chemotaxis transducer N-terminal domain-containing protein [Albitalea sp.]|nr:type IV pili methyl-accepting chemotaxis transducer N-terminal domain-containing protein [Albitalea sp.]
MLQPSAPAAPPLQTDLEAAGIHVIGAVQRSNLVQEAAKWAPDAVVLCETSLDDTVLELLQALRATAPRPVLLFTADADADKMVRALDAGVHAYVVNGYAAARLRPLVHLAQARFAHERRLRDEVAELAHRFEERKLVDRAKGILMRARPLSEDEAFRLLRTASMHSNQRVGKVSQLVIETAACAEAVNRAGQLRMLSQRLIKLCALQALEARSPLQELIEQSVSRLDTSLASLAKGLSSATYGDLVDAVASTWAELRQALSQPTDTRRLAQLDALAERVLLHADRLVAQLQSAGGATRLHVVNVAGRQRMLSQRLAKQALLGEVLRGAAAAAAQAEADKARQEFEMGLAYLEGAPLTTPEIRDSLDEASRGWGALTRALALVGRPDGQRALADSSEALLAVFERLTDRYEHSMQILMG